MQIRFEHPVLPSFLNEVYIRNLNVADTVVDLSLGRHPNGIGINVLHRDEEIEVVVVK